MFVNNLAKGRKLMRNLISIAIVAAAAAGIPATIASAQSTPAAAAAKPSPPPEAALALEAGEGRAVATKLADELVKSFVFTDQAEAYAAMLRKNAAGGRYDNGTRGELAKLMTDDLLAVHKDGHLHLMVRRPDGDPRPQSGSGPARLPDGFPPLIQAAKTIAPGIGYIRLTGFFGTDDE